MAHWADELEVELTANDKGKLIAVDMAGRPIARIVLTEGADALDAELTVLRGNVPGAHDVREAAAVNSDDAALIAFYEAKGYAKDVAKRMAGGGEPEPFLPTVYVEPVTPRRDLTEGRRQTTRAPGVGDAIRALQQRNGGERVELREVPRGKTVGYVDFGGGRTAPAEFDESGRLVTIGGRAVR